MPFDTSQTFAPKPSYVGVSEHDNPDPGYLDIIASSARLYNPIISTLTSAPLTTPGYEQIDQGFDLMSRLKEEGMEDWYDHYENVFNEKAFSATTAQIRREEADKKINEASGWFGSVSNMVFSMADPTTLLPGGNLVRAGKIGYGAFRSAASVAIGAGAASAIQEGVLQATQETRTARESYESIGGSILLGGVLGTAGARILTARDFSVFGKALKTELSDASIPNPAELAETIVGRARAAGAAAVDDIKLDDLGVAGPKVADMVARATDAVRINPGVSLMLSPSQIARETYAKAFNNPLYLRMNEVGDTFGPAAENLMKQYRDGLMVQWLRTSKSLYRDARRDGYRRSWSDFMDEVTNANRFNDIAPDGNVHVSKAAQAAREKIYDPLLKRAQERGLLPENVSVRTAETYATRMWNRPKLIAKEALFREKARAYFQRAIDAVPAGQRPDFISDGDKSAYIDEIVTEVFNNLTGRGKGDVPEWMVPAKRGPLQERTFGIPDADVHEFLEHNAELILRRYTRLMSADIELAEKFGRPDMRDQLDAIRNEYQQLRQAQPERAADLVSAEARDIRSLETFRDMLRGTFRASEEGSPWSRATRVALLWNFITRMGGLVKASLTDPARIAAVHGMRATMSEALPSLVSNTRALQIAKQDARDLGVVAEVELQTRLATLSDLTDPYASGSLLERTISNASHVFAKYTGIAWWNDALRTIGSRMTTNRILRNVTNYDGIAGDERAYLAYLGIDSASAKAIAKQFAKHGVEERGIRAANLSEWDDDGARRIFGAAMAKDTDRTIIQRDVSDVPIWSHTNTGKLVTQFARFGLASHQKVLLVGLQERPLRLAEFALFSTTLGMLTSYLSLLEVGKLDEAQKLLENPGAWIADGFDRAGLAYLITEPWNRTDKFITSFGGQNIGMKYAAGLLAGDDDPTGVSSRYQSRNATGTVLGPSAGMLEDWAKIIAALTTGELNNERAGAILGQIPGATLPGVRTGVQMGIRPEMVPE